MSIVILFKCYMNMFANDFIYLQGYLQKSFKFVNLCTTSTF